MLEGGGGCYQTLKGRGGLMYQEEPFWAVSTSTCPSAGGLLVQMQNETPATQASQWLSHSALLACWWQSVCCPGLPHAFPPLQSPATALVPPLARLAFVCCTASRSPTTTLRCVVRYKGQRVQEICAAHNLTYVCLPVPIPPAPAAISQSAAAINCVVKRITYPPGIPCTAVLDIQRS